METVRINPFVPHSPISRQVYRKFLRPAAAKFPANLSLASYGDVFYPPREVYSDIDRIPRFP